MSIPTQCPCDNQLLSHMRYGAPNEAWCDSCDGIVVQNDDGTVERFSGTRLMVEGI